MHCFRHFLGALATLIACWPPQARGPAVLQDRWATGSQQRGSLAGRSCARSWISRCAAAPLHNLRRHATASATSKLKKGATPAVRLAGCTSPAPVQWACPLHAQLARPCCSCRCCCGAPPAGRLLALHAANHLFATRHSTLAPPPTLRTAELLTQASRAAMAEMVHHIFSRLDVIPEPLDSPFAAPATAPSGARRLQVSPVASRAENASMEEGEGGGASEAAASQAGEGASRAASGALQEPAAAGQTQPARGPLGERHTRQVQQ